jgi:hypothetical protein
MRQPRLRRKRQEAPPGPPWACGELVWAWLAGQSRERRMLTEAADLLPAIPDHALLATPTSSAPQQLRVLTDNPPLRT